MNPLKRVTGLECNHRLLGSLAVAALDVEVSIGVSVVHEVKLGEDTVGICGVNDTQDKRQSRVPEKK